MATRAREDQWARNQERVTAPGSYLQVRLTSAGPPVVLGKDTAMEAAYVKHGGGQGESAVALLARGQGAKNKEQDEMNGSFRLLMGIFKVCYVFAPRKRQ